jgi:fatty-acyl-CoA synthase
MRKPPYYRFVYRYLSLVALKNRTLGRTVEQAAARRPEAIACLFEDERITYGELNRRANRRANLFRSLGVGKGDVVCLLMENRPEYLETVVGLAKIGAVTAQVNYNLKDGSLTHSINLVGARRIIVGLECLAQLQVVLPSLERIRADAVYVDTRWVDYDPPTPGMHDLNTLLAHADDGNPQHAPMNSKDPVLFIYTSGTTGLPKAARINHYRWYAAGLVMGYYAMSIEQDDVLYCPLPLYHSNGCLIAFGSAMVTGATFALTRRFSASRFWDEAKQYGATAFVYIGEVLRYLVNSAAHPGERTHRVLRILGNGLRPDIWPKVEQRFGIPHIREFYASTEGNAVTVNVDDTSGSVGTSVLHFADNTTLVRYDLEKEQYVRDGQGFCIHCRPGEVGELLGEIKSTHPFYGYSDAKETERKILRNVYKKGDAYFRTGDLMKQDAAGHYFFVDRIGDTYRWKGENVATQEVQEVLSGFGGVHLVSVYGVQVPNTEGRVGMAALQMEEGRAFEPAAFYRFAGEMLPVYAVPAFVRLVGEMDITGTFKLRKVELQRQGFDPQQVQGALYYLDRRQGSYVPLDAAAFQGISGGQITF